jgi:opacity protein-like surface antigen
VIVYFYGIFADIKVITFSRSFLMKKIMAIAALFFVCAGAAVFGQTVRMSVGGGGFFTADFTSYTMIKEAEEYYGKASDNNSTLIGAGFYGFFDATYIEANLGLLFGNEKNDKTPSDEDMKKGYDVTALKIGIFGKYPFQLGETAAVFPMIGLDIMLPLGGKVWGHDPTDSDYFGKSIKSDFDKQFTQIWVKFGVGADFYVTNNIFIRPEFMYGIRFNTDSENKHIGSKFDPAADPDTRKIASSIFGHGLDIRVAVGYSF